MIKLTQLSKRVPLPPYWEGMSKATLSCATSFQLIVLLCGALPYPPSPSPSLSLSDSSWFSDLSLLVFSNVSGMCRKCVCVCVLTAFTAYKRNVRTIYRLHIYICYGSLDIYIYILYSMHLFLTRCVWRAEQGQGIVSGQKPRARTPTPMCFFNLHLKAYRASSSFPSSFSSSVLTTCKWP